MRNLLPLLLLVVLSCSSPSYDIIIKGGKVLDGTGATAIKADVAIQNGMIVKIGDLGAAKATKTIDATGLIVSPGFIDLHAHIEPIMSLPDAESNVRQGVTTAVGGPDGGGPMPFKPYLDSLDKFRLGINVAYLTGHNVIRYAVMKNDNRKPTPEELEKMKALVKDAMDAGAFGISTGLKYMPGTFSETSEVIELSKVAAAQGGFYTSHLREEGLGLIAGVKEAIVIGKEASIPIVLTHHKAIGKPMWGKSVVTLGLFASWPIMIASFTPAIKQSPSSRN
jgi:dihydroorotase/N-acyl-D-amino-acid deacylase